MGNNEAAKINNIVKFTCTVCHANTIYINALDHQNNNSPFNSDQYTCTECSHGMLKTVEEV